MHLKFFGAVLLATATATPALAQNWAPWYQPSLLDRPSASRTAPVAAAKPKLKSAARPAQPPAVAALAPQTASLSTDDDDEPRSAVPAGPVIVDGGPKPVIAPQSPKRVTYASSQPAGTIVIDSAARRLYLIQSPTTALSYPVSVGREGFTWRGTEKISRVASWPDWHPPAEMRERDPRLPTKMTGGLRNPLGAKALYLGNTLYRIHGTSDARSIGRAASSGCFRMHNGHVVDLANRVRTGTRVVVINARDTRTAAASTTAPKPR